MRLSMALDQPAETPSSIPAADFRSGGAEQSGRREMARNVNYVHQTANSGIKQQTFRVEICQWWPKDPKGHSIDTRLSELSYGRLAVAFTAELRSTNGTGTIAFLGWRTSSRKRLLVSC
jgi:hypothetical protein